MKQWNIAINAVQIVRGERRGGGGNKETKRLAIKEKGRKASTSIIQHLTVGGGLWFPWDEF